MKKNNVISKILCVFKPKKMPSDILTEAENIINQYISHDVDFIEKNNTAKKPAVIFNIIVIASLAIIGYIALKQLR